MTDNVTDMQYFRAWHRDSKSVAMKIFMERQLDKGISVAVYTSYGFRIMKRFKHLTRIHFADTLPKVSYW